MPWARLDDGFYDHPKLDHLGNDVQELRPIVKSLNSEALVRLAAIGLWARAISYCSRHLTDGHVPASKLAKLDGSTELADHLVTVGLFERTPTGYLVHDFLDYNPSRKEDL